MYSRYNTKYFYSENFLNLYEARNLAIEKASGKYICFLDVDDFWEKDKLKFQVNFLEKNPALTANFPEISKNAKKQKHIKKKRSKKKRKTKKTAQGGAS